MKRLKDHFDPKYSQISFYVVFTAIITYILYRVINNIEFILPAVGKALHWIGLVLMPLIIGFIIFYLLDPIVDFLEKRIKKLPLIGGKIKGSRGIAVLITYAVIIAGLVLVLSILISALTRNIRLVRLEDIIALVQSIAKGFQDLSANLTAWLEEKNLEFFQQTDIANTVSVTIQGAAASIGNYVLSLVTNLPGILTTLLFAIIFSIYILIDEAGLKKYWHGVLKALSNEKAYQAAMMVLSDADRIFSGYIRGQLLDTLCMGIMCGVSLSIIGVSYAPVIGALTGVANLIPYMGPVIAYGGSIIVCLMQGQVQKLIIALIVLFIIQTLDGNVIEPKLMGVSVDVHPMLVIVALLFGGQVGGLVGMLLAVPVAAILKIQFDRLVDLRTQQKEKSADAGGQ